MARPMKYYLYISDAKVDMLYGQRPRRLFSRVEEFRFGVKGVDVGIKNRVTEESRYAKLQLVVNYLTKHTKIGTVEAPQGYFRGTVPLSWGMLESASSLVFFGGTINGVVLGLTGSQRHVLGAAQQQPIFIGAYPLQAAIFDPVIKANDTASYTYRPHDYLTSKPYQPPPMGYAPQQIVNGLNPPQAPYGAYPPAQYGSIPMPFQPVAPGAYPPPVSNAPLQQFVQALGGGKAGDNSAPAGRAQTLPEAEAIAALDVVREAVERMRGAPQKLEFLAKTLLHGELPPAEGQSAPVKVLLGTPVYVALAE